MDFFQELRVAGKNNQNLLALTGHHAKGGIIGAAVVPRGQNAQPHIVVLVGLIGAVIHSLIEEERIAAIEGGISVFLAGENVLENHLRNLGDDLRGLHIFLFNLVVDFLFLIGQEDIDAAVFLHEHLPHQDLQRFLHAAFQFDPIIVNVLNHQAGDIVDVRFNLQHILNHEEGFQDIDGKDIPVLLLRVDVAVVVGADDDTAMAVIQEVFQRVIEAMEGDDHAHLFVHEIDGGLLEERQHGALTAGQMLARRTVGTDGGQYAGKQVELIRHKGIDLCKIGFAGIQLFLCRVVEDD